MHLASGTKGGVSVVEWWGRPAGACLQLLAGSFPHVLKGFCFVFVFLFPVSVLACPLPGSLVRNKGCVQQRILGPGSPWLGPGPEGCQS